MILWGTGFHDTRPWENRYRLFGILSSMFRIKSLVLHSPIIQAPMAGCTDLAFRLLAREYGLELAFLEMISAEAFVRKTRKTMGLLKTLPADKPVGVQLLGINPDVIAEAAGGLEEMGFDIVDINLGCPVSKVIRGGAGAALMKNPARVQKIFRAVIKKIKKIPVTAKMRKGFQDSSGSESLVISRLAEDEGLAAVTVHGRIQPQGYGGHADWEIIGRVKKEIKIPVIGNGDVFNADQALRLIQSTGCDAVMIGRGSLGNPWIYRDIENILRGKEVSGARDLSETKQAALRHLELELKTSRNIESAIMKCRRMMCWYFKHHPGISHFRREIHRADRSETIRELINHFGEDPKQ
ncbi:MAG: tRNA dihydrouridine synthase DusB [Candidatus Omnitrophica bacterium]|nr:tRNA dihydrouridine synthase DusB [Candidatus Omnitrophota bacterium]